MYNSNSDVGRGAKGQVLCVVHSGVWRAVRDFFTLYSVHYLYFTINLESRIKRTYLTLSSQVKASHIYTFIL